MTTNITNLTNINSMFDLGKYASDSSGGLFWGVIIIVLFIVIIVKMSERGIENAVIGASFACLIISIIFLNLNFLQLLYPIFFALALAGAIFAKKFKPE